MPIKPSKNWQPTKRGIFRFLPPGKYVFTFQFVGMNPLKRKVEVFTRAQTDLGKIVLSESSTQLDEVSIVAQRPLVKVEIDKLTYNAKDDPEASTSNVLDLLRKVPMVTVDAEDNIQLKGSSNFKIYLNGKPSNMITNNPSQVLKSMPANSIKDIEVITDPGAKYDAEGVGGIINIITDKRVDDGYSGSVGSQWRHLWRIWRKHLSGIEVREIRIHRQCQLLPSRQSGNGIVLHAGRFYTGCGKYAHAGRYQ